MTQRPGGPVLAFSSRAAWRAWLVQHHATSDGLWVKLAKKGSGIATVSYPDAVEEALCFGWIDSQTNSFDTAFYLQRFTPRRARSNWSRINRERVVQLSAAGLMQPAGLAEVERAKADGRWEAASQ